MRCPFKMVGPEPPSGSEIWYRAVDRRYANYDPFAEFDQLSGSHLVIEVERFELLRSTPRGVWLRDWLGSERFVLGEAAKQFATPTLDLALFDLKARKKKHVRMAEARANLARQHLEAAALAVSWAQGHRKQPQERQE